MVEVLKVFLRYNLINQKMKFINFYIFLLISQLIIGCNKNQSFNDIEKKQSKTNRDDFELTEFRTNYKFEHFPVKRINTEKRNIKLNINQSSFTQNYKTMIRESFEKETINFAGKYILNYWGCGSPCQVGVVIDTENGKIIEIPSASVSYKFHINSRLLILNPPDSLNYYIKDCSYCKPELYYLDTIKNSFIKLKE